MFLGFSLGLEHFERGAIRHLIGRRPEKSISGFSALRHFQGISGRFRLLDELRVMCQFLRRSSKPEMPKGNSALREAHLARLERAERPDMRPLRDA